MLREFDWRDTSVEGMQYAPIAGVAQELIRSDTESALTPAQSSAPVSGRALELVVVAIGKAIKDAVHRARAPLIQRADRHAQQIAALERRLAALEAKD